MAARVVTCFDSLDMFEITTTEELDRCAEACGRLEAALAALCSVAAFSDELKFQRVQASAEFRAWADSFVER